MGKTVALTTSTENGYVPGLGKQAKAAARILAVATTDQKNGARVPTLLHLDGNGHAYVHAAAALDRAVAVVRNADDFIPLLVQQLEDCKICGDEVAVQITDRIVPATVADWDAEYLDAIVSVKVVSGGEFGMGAEIGIATGKMHARGPVGLEQLTSFKHEVHGDSQIRA